MDNDKIEMLKQLLSDPDIKKVVKELIDEPEQVVVKKPRKRVVKKSVVEATTKKIVKKASKKSRKKNPNNKNDPNFGRDYFYDDLSEATVEEINGKKVDLIANSKKLKAKKKNTRVISTGSVEKDCEKCNKKFDSFGGYLCDRCLKGLN